MTPSTDQRELHAVVEALEALSELSRDPTVTDEPVRYEIEAADGEALAELRALSNMFEDDDAADADTDELLIELDGVRRSYDLLRSLGD